MTLAFQPLAGISWPANIQCVDFVGAYVAQVEFEDSATRQVLWTSAWVEPLPDRGLASVSCAFPAALLKRQNHLVQLSALRANGTSELVTTYAFRAVVK